MVALSFKCLAATQRRTAEYFSAWAPIRHAKSFRTARSPSPSCPSRSMLTRFMSQAVGCLELSGGLVLTRRPEPVEPAIASLVASCRLTQRHPRCARRGKATMCGVRASSGIPNSAMYRSPGAGRGPEMLRRLAPGRGGGRKQQMDVVGHRHGFTTLDLHAVPLFAYRGGAPGGVMHAAPQDTGRPRRRPRWRTNLPCHRLTCHNSKTLSYAYTGVPSAVNARLGSDVPLLLSLYCVSAVRARQFQKGDDISIGDSRPPKVQPSALSANAANQLVVTWNPAGIRSGDRSRRIGATLR
jgi:hypothetical protein